MAKAKSTSKAKAQKRSKPATPVGLLPTLLGTFTPSDFQLWLDECETAITSSASSPAEGFLPISSLVKELGVALPSNSAGHEWWSAHRRDLLKLQSWKDLRKALETADWAQPRPPCRLLELPKELLEEIVLHCVVPLDELVGRELSGEVQEEGAIDSDCLQVLWRDRQGELTRLSRVCKEVGGIAKKELYRNPLMVHEKKHIRGLAATLKKHSGLVELVQGVWFLAGGWKPIPTDVVQSLLDVLPSNLQSVRVVADTASDEEPLRFIPTDISRLTLNCAINTDMQGFDAPNLETLAIRLSVDSSWLDEDDDEDGPPPPATAAVFSNLLEGCHSSLRRLLVFKWVDSAPNDDDDDDEGDSDDDGEGRGKLDQWSAINTMLIERLPPRLEELFLDVAFASRLGLKGLLEATSTTTTTTTKTKMKTKTKKNKRTTWNGTQKLNVVFVLDLWRYGGDSDEMDSFPQREDGLPLPASHGIEYPVKEVHVPGWTGSYLGDLGEDAWGGSDDDDDDDDGSDSDSDSNGDGGDGDGDSNNDEDGNGDDDDERPGPNIKPFVRAVLELFPELEVLWVPHQSELSDRRFEELQKAVRKVVGGGSGSGRVEVKRMSPSRLW